MQLRFIVLLVPRLIVGRCGVTRLSSYALRLKSLGSNRLAALGWKRVLRICARDDAKFRQVVGLCFRDHQYGAAAELASCFFDTNGLNPQKALELVGEFVLNGAYDSALELCNRFLEIHGDDAGSRSPSPSWDSSFDAHRLRAVLTAPGRSSTSEVAEGDAELCFARLCFSYGVYDTSASLFAKSERHSDFGTRDAIAKAYAGLRSDRIVRPPPGSSSRVTGLDADWRALHATVLFRCNDVAGAKDMISDDLPALFHEHADCEALVADCIAIMESLAGCPDEIRATGEPPTVAEEESGSTVRKIFVCGNGWTGSGAVCDELAAYDIVAEMPEAPNDDYLNEGTGDETLFVEGVHGLGHLWRTIRLNGVVRRADLWELFRCHVVGLGAIGYEERKCARATLRLTSAAGSRYSRVFRTMLEEIVVLRDVIERSVLYGILNTAAESLAKVFAGDRACIVLNNAVFGRNLDMLEIFRNFKVAVVVRNPLDTYADRRVHDLKHWMTPTSFAAFHYSNLQATRKGRSALTAIFGNVVREIEFERFVLDESYRQAALYWLLDTRVAVRDRSRFDPALSASNIGLHDRLLSGEERTAIETELRSYCRG